MSAVIVTTEAELARIVRAAVDAAMRERGELAAASALSEWIGIDEVAVLLGCGRDHVRKVRGLPAHKVGRLVRFRRAEVDAFIAGHRKSA